MVSTNDQALAIIADCWCHPDTENLNPDINASARLAKKVEELLKLLKDASEHIDHMAPWSKKYEQWHKENHGTSTVP